MLRLEAATPSTMSNSNLACPSSYNCGCEAGRLLALLGSKRFKSLQKEFGGKRIWIPKEGVRMPCGVCTQRDGCIRAWRRQGNSVAEISRHLGISPKTVYRVVGRGG